METLKQKIKSLAENQKYLKNQRKSINLSGTRDMPEWQACMNHFNARIDLREMHVVHALSKGRTYEQIEGSAKEPFTPEFISKLQEKYAKYIICDSEQPA